MVAHGFPMVFLWFSYGFSPNMLPSIRGSYLALRIAQIHPHPPGLLLACLPFAFAFALPLPFAFCLCLCLYLCFCRCFWLAFTLPLLLPLSLPLPCICLCLAFGLPLPCLAFALSLPCLWHCLLAAASASWLLPWLPPPWPPPLGCRLPGHLRLLPGSGWQLVWEAFPPLPIGNHPDPPGKKMRRKCGQTRCRCRHSAAVWPISIGLPALGDKFRPRVLKTTKKASLSNCFCYNT